MPRLRRYWRDTLALLLLLVAAPAWLALAYGGHRNVVLAVDALPVMLPTAGLHELEPLVDRPGSFRWTMARGELDPPNPGGQLYLRINLSSGLDTSTPTRLIAGASSYAFTVRPGLRTYSLLLPAQPGERVGLVLESPTVQRGGRNLGIVVQQLSLAGDGPVPVLIHAAMLLATIGAYGLLRRAGMRPLLAASSVLALQVGVSVWQSTGLWRYGLLGPLLALVGLASLAALAIERCFPSSFHSLSLPPSYLITSPPNYGRADYLAIGGLLLVALACCLPWLGAPDPVGDLELSARRMGFMYERGFADAFSYGGDYMPIRLYILRALSFVVLPLGGTFYEPLPAITRALIKLPSLLALLLTIALLYRWARRYHGVGKAALIAGLYAISPPVWMNVAWWGQVDVLLALPMLAAVALLEHGRGRWSWLCWAAGLLIKPQAIVLAPLLYLCTLRRYGPRGLAEGASVAAGLVAIACAPFVLIGQGSGLYQAAAGSVGRFPQVTNRAYNLWWLVAEDRAISDLVTFAGLRYRTIGFGLLGLAALVVSLAMVRRFDGQARAAGAAALCLAFFALPTQIHERYAFFALPFLLLCAATDRRALLAFAVLTATATINLLGAIRGFSPPLQHAIVESPLPVLVAWVHLALLIGLIMYTWIDRVPRTAHSSQAVTQP